LLLLVAGSGDRALGRHPLAWVRLEASSARFLTTPTLVERGRQSSLHFPLNPP